MESISWEALEYEYRPKKPDWFWALGIIALAGTVAAVLYENYIFAIFILLATTTLAYFALRRPEIIPYEINRKGVRIKEYLYPYVHLTAFWIEYNSDNPKLILHSDRTVMPIITVPLGDTDPDYVRDFLNDFLPEEEIHESVSNRIMEYFGF